MLTNDFANSFCVAASSRARAVRANQAPGMRSIRDCVLRECVLVCVRSCVLFGKSSETRGASLECRVRAGMTRDALLLGVCLRGKNEQCTAATASSLRRGDSRSRTRQCLRPGALRPSELRPLVNSYVRRGSTLTPSVGSRKNNFRIFPPFFLRASLFFDSKSF